MERPLVDAVLAARGGESGTQCFVCFEDYEKEIRKHLTGMLPRGTFDFDRDVESITVNRWPHGYTVGGPGDSTRRGRQPFGRITVANCDSAPGADMKTAIDMAARAVSELT